MASEDILRENYHLDPKRSFPFSIVVCSFSLHKNDNWVICARARNEKGLRLIAMSHIRARMPEGGRYRL